MNEILFNAFDAELEEIEKQADARAALMREISDESKAISKKWGLSVKSLPKPPSPPKVDKATWRKRFSWGGLK